MSKHKDKQAHSSQPAETATAAHPIPVHEVPAAKKNSSLTAIIAIGYVLVILVGGALYLTKEPRAESGTLHGISSADATVLGEKDGLSELYGVVQFKNNSDDVSRYFSLCETQPDEALRIFRAAFAGDSKSAKLVALAGSFYLAKHLQKEDVERIASRLSSSTEPDEDVRRAAQRALSDLTVIRDAGEATKFQQVPAGLPGEAHSIKARQENWDKEKVWVVRWSDPEVANAWWNALAKSGSIERNRYVIKGDTKG